MKMVMRKKNKKKKFALKIREKRGKGETRNLAREV